MTCPYISNSIPKQLPSKVKYPTRYFMIGRITIGELFFLFLVSTTLIAAVGDVEILGFKLCGWSWVTSGAFATMLLLLKRGNKISFPFLLWLPFLLYVALRMDIYSRPDIQRLAIIITPLIGAFVLSGRKVRNIRLIQKSYYILLVCIAITYLIACYQTSSLQGITDWNIPQGFSMTLVLIAVAGLVDWGRGLLRGLIAVSVCWLICFFTGSRMAVLVIPLLAIITPSRVSIAKKAILILCFIIGAVYLFYKPFVQSQIFFKGSGTLEEALELDFKTLKTGGRIFIWPYYIEKIRKRPFFGYGGTSSYRYGRFSLKWASHPHNEYIRILFDYGLVGLAFFLAPFIYLLIICYRRMRIGTPDIQWLYNVGTGGLLAWLLLAITGNVMLYVSWFGNLLFATIGAAFGITQSRKLEVSTKFISILDKKSN